MQVYDYIASKLLFQVKAPSALAFNKGRNLRFLDKDNLLMLQDSDNSFLLISIEGQVQAQINQKTLQEAKDITVKIEGPTVIDNNFTLENEMMEEADKNSEESELAEKKSIIMRTVECSQSIQSIFTNRSTAQLGNIAVVSPMRF